MRYTVKMFARSAALLVGLASTAAVAFLTWFDAVHHDSALLFGWCLLLLPAIPLAITWRKDLYADPMILPALLLGFCTFVCFMISALELFEPGMLQGALGQSSAGELLANGGVVWLTVVCSLFAAAGLPLVRFVYMGSLSCFHAMRFPWAGRTSL